MTEKLEPTHTEKLALKQKFHDVARAQYPDVGEPGTVWVLTEVLGWSWEDVTQTPIDGFSREGYARFILVDGKRQRHPSHPDVALTIHRKWTKEEKQILKDWWWLIGY